LADAQKRLDTIFELKDNVSDKIDKLIKKFQKIDQVTNSMKSSEPLASMKVSTAPLDKFGSALSQIKSKMEAVGADPSLAKVETPPTAPVEKFEDTLKKAGTTMDSVGNNKSLSKATTGISAAPVENLAAKIGRLGPAGAAASSSISSAFSKIKSTAAGVFAPISGQASRAKAAFESVKSAGMGIWGKISPGASKVFTPVMSGAQRAVSSFSSMASSGMNAFNRVKGAAQSLGGSFNSIRNSGGKIFSTLASGGLSLIPGFNSIKSAAGSALGSIKSGAESAGSGFGSMTKSIFGAQLAMSALSKAMGLITSQAGAAVTRVDSINLAKKSITTLTGSAKEASKVMDAVTDKITGTPIALDQVTGATKGLVASGMDMKQIPDVIQAIGDASFGVGQGTESIDQLSNAFKAMQASGTLQLEDLNRVVDANVPAIKILANQYGKSVPEMKKAISDGSIKSEDAIKKLTTGIEKGTDGVAGKTAALAGQMGTASDSIQGAWGSIKTSITKLLAKPIEMAYPQIVGALKNINGGIKNFTGDMEKTIDKVTPIATKMVKAYGPKIMAPISQSFRGVVSSARVAFGQLGPILAIQSSGFAQFGQSLIGIFGQLPNQLGSIANAINASVSGTLMNMISPISGAFSSLSTTLGPAINSALTDITNAFITAQPFFMTFGSLLGTIFQAIAAAIPPIITAVGTFAQGIGTSFQTIAPYVTNLATVFSNLATAIVPAIQGLGTAIGQAFTIAQPFVAAFASAFTQVVAAIGQAIPIIINTVSALMPIFAQIVAAVSPVVEAIGHALSVAITTVAQFMAQYWPMIAQVIQQAVAIIAPVITTVINVIAALIPPFVAVVGFIISMFIPVWNGIRPVLAAAGSAIVAVGKFIIGLINASKPVGTVIGKAFQFMAKGVGAAISIVTAPIKWLLGAFGKIIDLASGVGSAIGKVGKWVGGLFGGGGSGKGHANGLDRVPYDGYQATLHKGERVLTPEETKNQDNGGGPAGGRPVVINMGGVTVQNGQDPEEIARYIAKRITELT
jgi:tape measure domain-containing protein